jgi:hypothetical protein
MPHIIIPLPIIPCSIIRLVPFHIGVPGPVLSRSGCIHSAGDVERPRKATGSELCSGSRQPFTIM